MSDRIWFVNPVEKKTMAAKKKKRPTRRNEQLSLGLGSRAMVLHRGGPGTMPGRAKPKKASKAKKPAAKKKAASHKPRATTMATKKKKRPKAVYKSSKRGRPRRTVAIKGPVFKASKRGKKRRVTRVNPARRHHARRRRNPGMPPVVSALLAVGAGFAAGVAVRVGTHMAMPTNGNAPRIAGAVGVLAGIAMAMKMSNPMFGIGIAVGSLDAAAQNDAVFKAEMTTAPATTQKALGAITYQNMAAIENARSIPGYAKMGSLPAYAKMGAIVADSMAGYANGNAMGSIASMRVQNPFER